jgi:hypothetical protein
VNDDDSDDDDDDDDKNKITIFSEIFLFLFSLQRELLYDALTLQAVVVQGDHP